MCVCRFVTTGCGLCCHKLPTNKMLNLSLILSSLRMNNVVRHVPSKPSLALQILMYCNVYLSIAWNIVYGFCILYNFSSLYDLHGICVIMAYLVGSIAECYRLRLGYKGNLHSSPGDLCTFLILSPFVQVPVLIFLFISAQNFATLIKILTLSLFVIMALEFTVGLIIIWPKSEKPIKVDNK